MDPYLRISDAHGQRIVKLDRPLLRIGRRSGADVHLTSVDISREHAEIVLDGAEYRLCDRGSRYGTFVNGEQITEHVLAHRDTIRLGRRDAGVELVFVLDATETSFGYSPSDLGDLRQTAAILNGLRAIGSGRVLDEVLSLVIDSAIDVTHAERGFIMLADRLGTLEFKTARARGGISLPGSSFRTSEKIPREVFQRGRAQMVADLFDDAMAADHGGTIASGIRHVLCVPLLVSAGGEDVGAKAPKVIGVLYLDGRERGEMTSQATSDSLEAFATQAALAIDSARLYAESAEKARTDRDLRIAAEIQRALLPDPTHERHTCDLAAASVPCRTVGGDFFDYLDVDGPALGFALGDVAGKGPPAALLAAVVQSTFIAQASLSLDPADTMGRINTAMLRRAIEARFATMCYGVVSPNGELRYCNAGQEPPLLIQRDSARWLETGGPVVGLLPSAQYESETVALSHGDLVVFYSDGVSEARNVANDEFGRDRILACLQHCHGLKSDAVLDSLLAAVNDFASGAPQADDITALVFRYRGQSALGSTVFTAQLED